MQKAFRIKQTWGVLQGKSLWAKVFSVKFLKNQHMLRIGAQSKSKCFRMLQPWFNLMVVNSQSFVSNGDNVDFWCSNWLGSRPLLNIVDEIPQLFPRVSEVLEESK